VLQQSTDQSRQSVNSVTEIYDTYETNFHSMRDWFDEFEVHGIRCRVVNDLELISARGASEQMKPQVSQN